ncbi:branched-chain amino acid ABC transporter substrate-binding protein [Vulcanimicrobium alpinum]|uniref:Branched-chain amino acid ABC transporter substrate-binding protein n=1 Tax=Vulcanimicrobium alpinum TaxID=3016050 RepID=A0AAN2C9Y9_UNVUL|nr:ABC transporter substrate-binding protein [Vulcanimicrobium alpinum]BDE06102.1 branched-chain amino acid ABC transporter substrate-binding protein [Vulcanimicrobium alpinum]
MNRTTPAALALCAIAALVAPAGAATKGPAAGKTVHVGVIADVTGAAGVYGTPQKNAYELANEDIKSGKIDAGGATLTFDVQDAASDGAQVVNLMQKFITDGSTAIVLGPTLSGEAFKAFPLAARANFPAMGTSTTAEGVTAIGPTIYRDALAESQVIPTTVKRTKDKWHYKTAAIIYGDDNAFTKTDGDIFAREFKAAGVDVVDTETFHQKDTDFQAALTRIEGKKPDVIAIGALFPEATKIIAQAGKLGIKTRMIGGNGLNSPEMYSVAGPAAQGAVVGAAWYSGAKYASNLAFVKSYTAKYGKGPDQFAAQAYAAAQIVAYFVAHGATTKDDMIGALKNVRVIQTVLGPIGFDPNRDVKSSPVILSIVKDGFAYFR